MLKQECGGKVNDSRACRAEGFANHRKMIAHEKYRRTHILKRLRSDIRTNSRWLEGGIDSRYKKKRKFIIYIVLHGVRRFPVQ